MRGILAIMAAGLLFPVIAAAQQEHSHEHSAPAPTAGKVALAITPERLPEAGQTIRVTSQLTLGGKPLEADELKVVHTQKFHLLVIDPTLTDYHHLHPQPTATPGSYLFTFTPKLTGGYRAWADITPIGGAQQFARADIGEFKPAAINKTESLVADVSGYHFQMSLDGTPKAGGMVMATILVTDASGKEVKSLEPVMGAFAHLVGFYDDYETILHAHPMGAEPTTDTARGGPELSFHLAPEKAGFVKLFVQVQIGGQQIFVPFGLVVQ